MKEHWAAQMDYCVIRRIWSLETGFLYVTCKADGPFHPLEREYIPQWKSPEFHLMDHKKARTPLKALSSTGQAVDPGVEVGCSKCLSSIRITLECSRCEWLI